MKYDKDRITEGFKRLADAARHKENQQTYGKTDEPTQQELTELFGARDNEV